MATHEYERPWQVLPAKIIKLALEHAKKDNDFDHQVAYLLLDIGVEAALKAYLVHRGQNVEKIIFPELLRKVKEELSRTHPDIVAHIDNVGYFHGIRNKLYHQGDGVKPTKDNLKRYSDLARMVVEQVLEVNLETEEKKHLIAVWGKNREVQKLVHYVENHFDYFQETCAIVAEKTRPAFATREFAMKLKYISDNWPDWDAQNLEDRMEAQKQRLEKFNELTGTKQTNYGGVDYVLEDINHFYVLIALQQTSDEWPKAWNEYKELDRRRPRLLPDWESKISSKNPSPEQVREEFEKIANWLEDQQTKLDKWIDTHLANISRLSSPQGVIDIQDVVV